MPRVEGREWPEDIDAFLRGQLDKYVRMSEAQIDAASRLELGDREKRLFEPMSRGTMRVRDALSMSSLRRSQTLKLFTALWAEGYIDFVDETSQEGVQKESLEEILTRIRFAEKSDFFHILDLHTTSTQEEIEQGYRRLMDRFAESRFAGGSAETIQAAERLRGQIVRAYQGLVDPKARAAYREKTCGAWKVRWYAEFQYGKGDDALFLRQSPQEALQLFTSALDLAPSDGQFLVAQAYARYSGSSRGKEDQKQALEAAQRGLRLSPGNPMALAYAARLELDCGRSTQAKETLRRLEKLCEGTQKYADIVKRFHLDRQ